MYTRPIKRGEIFIKQRIIPGRKFTVRVYVVLIKSGKGQTKIDNQRGMIIVRLYKSRVNRSNT
jgi:hypothetical protein